MTVDEPLVWDLSDSPYCMKVRIALQLKGIGFRRIPASLARRRELLALNPLGKVPVLVHGATTIADSTAIVRWVEEHRPHPALVPSDPAARAYCALIEDWADEVLGPMIGAFKWVNPQNRQAAFASTMPELVPGAAQPIMARLIARSIVRRYRGWGWRRAQLPMLEERMRANLRLIETLLADRAFLLGRSATVADIAVLVQLAWMRGYAEGRLLADVPVVGEWMARLEAEPAIASALPSC